MRTFPLLFATTLFAIPALAQDLRRALATADAVVVGRQVGKKAFDEALTLHKVQVVAEVRGTGGAGAVTVLDWPKLSLHNRPQPRQSRLYCLEDASALAERLGLPSSEGPYYKMTGYQGSNPLVGAQLDQNASVRLARVLAAAEAGAAPTDTATALLAMSLETPSEARTEAVRYLAERGDLRSRLVSAQWNQLLARTGGEVEDVAYKIALAELCCEQRLSGLLDALSLSLGPITDPEYARCVGRIGKVLHGEQATSMLQHRLELAGQRQDREMLLLAIGATNTRSALDALLQMDRRDAAVEAALKEHRSREAKEAVGKKRD
ncbi:MAG: hypothetical protein R3F29_09200 [Planctomycetota bacterium]